MVTQFRKKSAVETYIFKFLNTYVLISLLAMLTSSYMIMPHHSPAVYASVGLLTIYSFLIGRLERNKMVVQLNNNVMRFGADQLNMRMESLLIPASLLYFGYCLFEPTIAINKVTMWFQVSINDLYKTPIIGWIFAFIGVLMLFSLLIRSIFYSAMILNRLANGNRKSKNNNDDDYTDYEEIN
jgi:hypothetical protein